MNFHTGFMMSGQDAIIKIKKTDKSFSALVCVLIILVILLGFIVRIYKISANPAGLFADEAAIAYNAYTLVTRGTDEFGTSWPFFFRSFGDFRNPVPIYINIPSVLLFGLSEFAVRLTAVLCGSLTILILALVAWQSEVFSKKSPSVYALITAVTVALLPWHIHFSRFGSEYIYFPFFLALGWWLFLKGVKKPVFLLLSSLAFGVCIYTYYPTWIVTPLFILILCLIYRRILVRLPKFAIVAGMIFIISLVPLATGLKNGIALTRWQNVTITKNTRAGLTGKFLTNYLAHFSPRFLFTKGDIDYPGHFIRRFGSRGAGELYVWMLPFFIIGIIYAVISKTPFGLTLLGLLILYPLGSSLADSDGGAPLAFRSVIGIIPSSLLTALGLAAVTGWLRKQLYKLLYFAIIAALFTISSISYLYEYHAIYPLYASDFWGWQFGPRDIMTYFLSHKSVYDDLYLTPQFNAPQIFLDFYDPRHSCAGVCKVGELDRYDPSRRQLFAVPSHLLSEISHSYEYQLRQQIFYPDGSGAFTLLEIKSKVL
ncbi:hypothetical protein A2154_04450 [Candidatus Gottesmanbacteria bacterium RBG_16_43_7]|uniref:Glycosyltransferase RgtA/B/C/D-like domain-containing protein n=1 Tax=Candidatus Gottesmanbacteria bacterium RBG_16_43_7 TaxID=1798373 RepID=A0A1F5ZC27_9BACT|nr:MAG: hypothetical protein A2154_04450 [Candidatus Gottesmanbacteria bacterium RBG_16_43_7]